MEKKSYSAKLHRGNSWRETEGGGGGDKGRYKSEKRRILGEVQGKIRMEKHQRSENDFQTATDLLILARGCFIMLHSRLFVRGKT